MWELNGLTDNLASQLVINTGNAGTSSGKQPQCSDMDSHIEGIHSLPSSD